MIDIKRQNVTERCRRICAGYNEDSVCRFADNINNRGLLGFIDTSQGQNGTRGIAFSDKGAFLNFDGETIEILYKNIKSVQIISSFEDFFADELSIVYSSTHPDLYTDPNSDKEVRISDFSLDKSELKRLLDSFCGEKQAEDDQSDEPEKEVSEEFPKNEMTFLHTSGKPAQSLGDLSQNLGNLLQSVQSHAAAAEKASVTENIASEKLPEKIIPDKNIPDERDVLGGDPVSEFAADHSDIFDNEIPSIFRSQDDFVDIVFEDRAPVVTETILPPSGTRARVIENRDLTQIIASTPIYNNYNNTATKQQSTDNSNELYEDEAAERIRIQNMSPEETLSFLAQSLNEINSPLPEPVRNVRRPEPVTHSPQEDTEPFFRQVGIKRQDSAPPEKNPIQSSVQAQPQIRTQVQTQSSQLQAPATNSNQTIQTNQAPVKDNDDHAVREDKKPVVQITVPLTQEPIWGDIYIKASRNLRELCESGRISMGQIEKELDSRLLDSAKAFAEIIADESKVPKVLIPKITELKAASKNFDQYFQMGEDIAVRAMFFMMYQMLSYADRIVETPETKERLNDFFRRFGSAGITLSMLDMRV